MIIQIKRLFIICSLSGIIFLIPNCRQTYEPTDSDLSSYGWTYYEDGLYQEAFDWFLQSITEDSSYYDAYNGIGWSLGRLGQPELAVDYFRIAAQSFSDGEFKEYMLDFYAGLAFGYNALGNDEMALTYAKNYFFENQNAAITDVSWCFCHDEHINQLDVRLIEAVSEFRLGQFSGCGESINKAYGDLTNSLGAATNSTSLGGDYLDMDGDGEFNSGDLIFNGEWTDTDQDNQLDDGEERHFDEFPINYDYETVIGRALLANHLSLLASYTSIENGKNDLTCGCSD